PPVGIDAMLDYYAEDRFNECVLNMDGVRRSRPPRIAPPFPSSLSEAAGQRPVQDAATFPARPWPWSASGKFPEALAFLPRPCAGPTSTGRGNRTLPVAPPCA